MTNPGGSSSRYGAAQTALFISRNLAEVAIPLSTRGSGQSPRMTKGAGRAQPAHYLAATRLGLFVGEDLRSLAFDSVDLPSAGDSDNTREICANTYLDAFVQSSNSPLNQQNNASSTTIKVRNANIMGWKTSLELTVRAANASVSRILTSTNRDCCACRAGRLPAQISIIWRVLGWEVANRIPARAVSCTISIADDFAGHADTAETRTSPYLTMLYASK